MIQKKPGAKPNELLDRISTSEIDHTKSTTNKHYWTCIAPTCSHKRQGRRVTAEVAAHANQCLHLRAQDEAAWQAAANSQTKQALGTVLNLAESSGSKDSEPATEKQGPGRPRAIAVPDSDQSRLNVDSFRVAGKKKSAEQKHTSQKMADHKIMLLICKCGLVPDLLDRPKWAEFVGHLNPGYTPTSAKKFTHEYIPREATLVRQQTKEALQNSRDLTYSFDGTSVRRGDSFHTEHACTPKRDIYFLGGHFRSKESHDAEWIKNDALMVSPAMFIIPCVYLTPAQLDHARYWLRPVGRCRIRQHLRHSCCTARNSRRVKCNSRPLDVVHFSQHLIGDVNELPEIKPVRCLCCSMQFNFVSIDDRARR
jgi:hypothetical protein